jgi:hypothetical protein
MPDPSEDSFKLGRRSGADGARPQANLCSGGKPKRLSQRRIHALVAAAQEPPRP